MGFEIATGDMTAMLTHAYTIFGDFKILILLAIGLPLGFWGARKVIGLIRSR